MFGRAFFGAKYFGPRYWGDGGEPTPAAPAARTLRRLNYGIGMMLKTRVHPHPRFNS